MCKEAPVPQSRPAVWGVLRAVKQRDCGLAFRGHSAMRMSVGHWRKPLPFLSIFLECIEVTNMPEHSCLLRLSTEVQGNWMQMGTCSGSVAQDCGRHAEETWDVSLACYAEDVLEGLFWKSRFRINQQGSSLINTENKTQIIG